MTKKNLQATKKNYKDIFPHEQMVKLSNYHCVKSFLILLVLLVGGAVSWGQLSTPFTVSTDDDKYYYYIQLQSNTNYYMYCNDEEYATTATQNTNATMLWYFKYAGNDGEKDYYYIINKNSGLYLKSMNANGGSANAVKTLAYDSDASESFQFYITSAANSSYNIIPRNLLSKSNNCLNKYGGATDTRVIGTWRDDANSRWKFVELPLSAPVITYNAGDVPTFTITSSDPGVTFYYTTDGTDPTSESTLYNGAVSITEGQLPLTVKAIAIRNASHSEISSKTIIKVATPVIAANSGNTAIIITCATDGASIYYTVDGTDPTTSSNLYVGQLTEGVSGVTIKAFAIKDDNFPSDVASNTIVLTCPAPTITSLGKKVKITPSLAGSTIRYTLDGVDPDGNSDVYSGLVDISQLTLPITIKAYATAESYNASDITELIISSFGTGTEDDPYIIGTDADFLQFISDVSASAENAAKYYKIADNINGGGSMITQEFTGGLIGGADENGQFYTISGLTHPIFSSVNGAVIKNVILDNVTISSGDDNGDAGAIACSATGATRIYNCGVLATSASTVSGTRYVGSILGKLEGNTRVINCYSFATVNSGGWGAGIVGYNSTATTQDNIATSGMVMNCMFYGEVTSGSDGIAPVFGGANISNNNSDPNGKALNTFNYFRYMADYCQNGNITAYNCALGAKELHLKRFEFYRNLLNSNRELAAWYATGSVDNASDKMAKWVLDKSIADYPVLKAQGTYPSIINFDAAHATTQSERNQGGLLGSLIVNVTGTGTGAPAGASITKNLLILNITDKDPANYNYNYYKVQLPYYNEVGTKNYTGNKVVTGWKVTVSGGTNSYNTSSFDAAIDVNGGIATPYNFADRYCTGKDNFSTSGRIFPQGGYFNVPEGVTSISIEPYWGTAVYLADPKYDKVANKSYTLADVGAMGTRATTITNDGSEQTVCTTMSAALNALGSTSCTPYDQAVVLVGNYHIFELSALPFGNSKPCTIMSIDQNKDNEPDCSLMIAFKERRECPPIRFDFLNFVPFGIAQKVFADAAPQMPNIAIFKPKGWFEVTTTCITEMTEFEYDGDQKAESPLILLGGHIGQIISQNINNNTAQRTTYIHLGDNVLFDDFCNGAHSDKTNSTRHCPISVTGGEYENFYLSGLYKPGVTPYDDGAECYINGGKFGEMAGAAHEKIAKDVYWVIDHADIENFYGGGINDANPVLGNINVTINNSNVGMYCGGPKFGDMQTGKTVTTNATGTTFGTFFGAGYGGTALNRVIVQSGYQTADYSWSSWVDSYTRQYVTSAGGTTVNAISTSYETEFFAWAGGTTTSNVGRFYVNFASLSLANTKDVTSSLTNCTITNNFYGGGSLGAVNGAVTSTLTDCTVYGSVFGAGFSASVPTVTVYPTSGFVRNPSYNSNVGVFNDPVYPKAETYTWAHSDVVDADHDFDDVNKLIYTTINLNGLGVVTGAITLTLNGATTVGTLLGDGSLKAGTGDVFGGGDESGVVNSNGTITSVNLMDDVRVLGNVFGGGNRGLINGHTEVNITD